MGSAAIRQATVMESVCRLNRSLGLDVRELDHLPYLSPSVLRRARYYRARRTGDGWMKNRFPRIAPIGLTFVLAILVPFQAHAWEVDAHYGLTKWLAYYAGYSLPEARLVAEGNLATDNSVFTDPVLATILGACRDPSHRDPIASIAVHNNHFPSRLDPPNDPTKRAVEPGKVWQDGRIRVAPDLDGTEATYLALGRYLHALQDTWSHRGEPDIPELCEKNRDLAWGHAVNRGGWACHIADITHLWAPPIENSLEVVDMAKATYDRLIAGRTGTTRENWAWLEPKILEFAAKDTKWAKHDWFEQEDKLTEMRGDRGLFQDDFKFIQETSLPDVDPKMQRGRYPFDWLVERWKEVRPLVSFFPTCRRMSSTSTDGSTQT
jgi:hypothetical protein